MVPARLAEFWVSVVKPGRIMFESAYYAELATEALRLADTSCCETKMVTRPIT